MKSNLLNLPYLILGCALVVSTASAVTTITDIKSKYSGGAGQNGSLKVKATIERVPSDWVHFNHDPAEAALIVMEALDFNSPLNGRLVFLSTKLNSFGTQVMDTLRYEFSDNKLLPSVVNYLFFTNYDTLPNKSTPSMATWAAITDDPDGGAWVATAEQAALVAYSMATSRSITYTEGSVVVYNQFTGQLVTVGPNIMINVSVD